MGHVVRAVAIGIIGSMLTLTAPIRELKNLFIGKIGGNDGDRFSLLLSDELAKRGFVIVDQETGADGILTGAVTTVMEGTKAAVHATMMLKDVSGVVLWRADIAPKTNFSIRDPLHSRAIDVAERLQKSARPSKDSKAKDRNS